MKSRASPPLFQFESADAIARVLVLFAPLAGGGVVAVLALDFGGWRWIAGVALACLIVACGLRSSISVFSDQVIIQRKWFFIPYQTYEAGAIEDVSYGGDWGLEEGAVGVVVSMGGREVHLGTPKTMRYLHDALTQVAYSRRQHEG